MTNNKHPLAQVDEALNSVLCATDGKCCISGSDEDRKIVDKALTTLREYIAESEGKVDLDNAREVFENWLTGGGNYPHLKHKFFGGTYLSEEAAMKWDGFKAGYYAQINAEQDKGYKNDDQ